MSILAIDAGNTRVKWALFDQAGQPLEQGACLHTGLPSVRLPAAEQVVISNVAGDTIATQLKELLHHHAYIHWVISTAFACGVTNGYKTPETLGTDRWASLIAAWHMQRAPCVVVNAGTAVTIDSLDAEGGFVGGLILPGFALMQQSLHSATAQLPISNDAEPAHVSIFATNTLEAIYAGGAYAIAGAIHQMVQQLQQHSQRSPTILISGGNAEAIKNYLASNVTKQVLIVDNLVLQGLFLLETMD